MPPPTSPENDVPERVNIPQLFGLRHLMSRDFFNHMNEVLANLLSEYTEEQRRRNLATLNRPPNRLSMLTLLEEHYRRSDLLDHSMIRTTHLPPELRNLSSPVRFLVIPDLEEEMDLDIDLDENSPRATSSNVGSRGSNAVTSTPSLAQPVSSPSSAATSLRVQSPLYLHLDTMDSENDDNQDASSSPHWSSDEDGEFEEPSDHEVDAEAHDSDEESNSESDTSSSDSDEDERAGRSSSEIAHIEARNNLLDSMQLAQRLLLSSARQNPTNRNTLIITPDLNRVTGGVPLRRQNAIRVKRRDPDSTQKSSEEVAKAYHTEFEEAIKIIRACPQYPGKSPIFNSGTRFPFGKRNPVLRRWGTLRHLSRKSNLDAHMDKFLCQRRAGKLWPDHQSVKGVGSRISHVKRLCSVDLLPHRTKRYKHHYTTKEDSSNKYHDIIYSINNRERVARKHRNKRRHDNDERSSRKRRRIKGSSFSKAHVFSSVMVGDHIDENLLTRDEKYSILSGLPCTFLSSGSSFTLGPNIDCHSKRASDVLNMNFSHVDNEKKLLHGYLDINNDGSAQDDFPLLSNLISYLCGGIRSQFMLNCTNKVIQMKAALLNDVFMLSLSVNGKDEDNITSCLQKSLKIPFHGEIVDFDKNDLRFLPQTKYNANKSSTNASYHHSRVRNEQVKLQLLEWLRIRPFSNFSENFFMNYLIFIEKRLREFDKYTRHEQELTLEFTHQFKELIYEVTREFDFVTDDIPMYKDKFRKAMWDLAERFEHEPRYDLPKSFFLLEWESKLCEKLCEHFTYDDSCLLNVQLNYVLFTIRVDVSSTLDEVFYRFLDNIKEENKKVLISKYAKLAREALPEEAREAVFVCSINRKTGRLEMQNTRLYLDYKYAGSCDTNGGRGGSSSDSDEDDDFISRRRYTRQMHWKCLEDPYLMHTPTMMYGKWKRNFTNSYLSGGGQARADFA